MTVMDIVALAKAGYTPAQVKELISLAEAPASPEEPQTNTGTQKTPGDPEQVTAPEKAEKAETEKETKEPTPEQNASAVDYKSLYEKAAEDLKAAQAKNVSTDISPQNNEDPEKDLRDIFASYM